MAVHLFRILAVLLMLSLPLHAQNATVPKGYENFHAYEVAMFQRIDELATRRGADIAAIRAMRDGLRTKYSEAERRSDKAGMAEARAIQAHVIRLFLEKLSQ